MRQAISKMSFGFSFHTSLPYTHPQSWGKVTSADLKTTVITQSHKDHQEKQSCYDFNTKTNQVNGTDSAIHRFLRVLRAFV
jgi:hypothetical protein